MYKNGSSVCKHHGKLITFIFGMNMLDSFVLVKNALDQVCQRVGVGLQ